MKLSGKGTTICQRISHLKDLLDGGKTSFLAAILDYEDAQTSSNPLILPRQTVTIEAIVTIDGYLNNQDIPEAVWLDSISRETKLDCRMILNFTPLKEIGLYPVKVIVSHNGKAAECDINLWIVPCA